jgi:hypothetical protein
MANMNSTFFRHFDFRHSGLRHRTAALSSPITGCSSRTCEEIEEENFAQQAGFDPWTELFPSGANLAPRGKLFSLGVKLSLRGEVVP